MKNKILLSVLLVSLLSLSFVVAHTGEDDFGHHSMMGGMYGGTGMFFGWIFGILVLLALILLIVWLIKQIQKK